MDNKQNLINEFKKELSILMKLRIDSYHNNHISQFEFINLLITCPPQECWDRDFIKTPMLAIKDFLSNLNIEFACLETLDLNIDKNFKPNYHFSLFPFFIDEEFDGDFVQISYCDGKIKLDDYFCSLLAECSKNRLRQFVKNIQSEISFGSLKLVA